MMVTMTEMTSRIERYVSSLLVRSYLKKVKESADWNSKTASFHLSDLYILVRSAGFNFDVPAGLFNKVIDDMTRIGLLKVDRKTKHIENIAFDKLVSQDEMSRIKTEIALSAEEENVGGDS